MKRYLSGWLLAVVLYCLWPVQSQAAEQEPLHWGFVHFPPFYYLDEQGQAAGRLATLLKQVMVQVGRHYEYQQYPNRRMIHKLNTSKLDIALVMTSVLEDRDQYLTSRCPISSMTLSAFWLGERPKVKQISDLFGSRVILMSGFSYGGLRPMLKPGYGVVREMVEVGQHQLGIEALQLNRGDYLLNYKETATLALSADEAADVRHSVLSEIPVYFLLRADLPDSHALMQQIEQALTSLVGDSCRDD
ncbi:transporter substrate-binding domain-containing protein [Alkalimonas delamerensis]|uniref:Transporter substrate-binding domain-containing protein n=1 Tax=Alkalimonas delamerensis TaxID=265981 RepID=A0ABT9GNH0_9GAMM|nr:transporter substrate-binding domain-containing protein [Alkalimonas delamerensis]MDP4528516.1 transporter substrate-binding domain-containing protein [Alkalimonas delamerensis]